MFKYIIILNLLGQILPAAERVENQIICSNDEICSLTRPLSANDGSTHLLPFKFKYRPAKNGAPTVVFIPGGPGDILSQAKTDKFLGVPEDFGVILIDARFIGINSSESVKNFTNSITSVGVAQDILFTVKALNISNYILYGVSYGTVPATIASSLATDNPPRAILLDGTVGKSFSQLDYFKAFSKQWSNFIQTLDPNTFLKFKEKVKNLIKQKTFTADEIGSVIQVLLMSRNGGDAGKDILQEFVTLFSLADDLGSQYVMEIYVNQIRKKDQNLDRQLFHSIIVCKELSPDTHPDSADFSFNGESDELKDGGRADCNKYVKTKEINLFDSKQYQVHSPVLYFQGEDDPATPISHSLYHFHNQIAPMGKSFIYRPKGAHGLLYDEFSQCAANFWEKLNTSVDDSLRELEPCGATINPNFIQQQ